MKAERRRGGRREDRAAERKDSCFFFFNDTATTEIYTFPTRRSSDLNIMSIELLNIRSIARQQEGSPERRGARQMFSIVRPGTRLNSSHEQSWYAVLGSRKIFSIIGPDNPKTPSQQQVSPALPCHRPML